MKPLLIVAGVLALLMLAGDIQAAGISFEPTEDARAWQEVCRRTVWFWKVPPCQASTPACLYGVRVWQRCQEAFERLREWPPPERPPRGEVL
jgi:hypothetical protein